MQWSWACLVSAMLIMGGAFVHAEEATRPAEEDARLNTVFHDYLKELFRREPLTATRLGEHSFDDQLDDLSADARKATLDFKLKLYYGLGLKIAVDKLSPDGRIDYEIFRKHLEREVWLAQNFRPFEDDPRIYGDYISESVYLLLTQSSLPRESNLKNALARMDKIPAVIATARRTIANPPRVKVETAIRQTEGAIGFYSRELFTLAGAVPGQGELAAKAGAVVAALKDHLAFLQKEVLPRSTEAWRIGRDRVPQEARPRARCGHHGGRGACRRRTRGSPGRDRDGRDRPPALGHPLPRHGDPPRRRARTPRDDWPGPRKAGR